MKKSRRGIVLICTAGLLLLALLLWPGIRSLGESRYSRRVEEDFFFLRLERLNTTIAEAFPLKAGDAIEVTITRISGELSVSIGQENREPIYTGRNPELGSFYVTVPEDGIYLLSVSGKQAEGSISFQIRHP